VTDIARAAGPDQTKHWKWKHKFRELNCFGLLKGHSWHAKRPFKKMGMWIQGTKYLFMMNDMFPKFPTQRFLAGAAD
jgi:hypothetical protein